MTQLTVFNHSVAYIAADDHRCWGRLTSRSAMLPPCDHEFLMTSQSLTRKAIKTHSKHHQNPSYMRHRMSYSIDKASSVIF
jgi:hypothetical protein